MKKILTLLSSMYLGLTVSAQVLADSATTGASYINDVFYSLPNGTVRTEPRDNWDLGFEISGNASSILANTQANARVYQSPFTVANWSSFDTSGFNNWQRLDNSPTSWSQGALNSNNGAGGGFDLGWGIYDFMGTNGPQHAVNGDSVFLVKLNNGTFKKLRIDRLFNSEYAITWADINGQNEVKDTVAKGAYAGKNFGYYSIANSVELDREPATADWDLLFTRYITYDYGMGVGSPQSVTGVLLNKNVKAVRIAGVHDDDLVWENYIDSFKTDKNVIGHNWKGVNYAPPPTWLIEDSLTFLIRRPVNGEVWKAVFTGFGGSGSGKYFFNKELLLAAPAANVTAASLTVCAGDTVILTANSGTGFTYQWYKGATLINGATSATLKATLSGNYSVKVTDRGAFSLSTAVEVKVTDLPTATAGTVVDLLCADGNNGSIAIVANGGTGNAYTYTWTGASATTAQAQNLSAGTYSVVVADSLGCEATEVTVTLTAPTAISISASSQGSSATATVTGGVAPYSYLWSDAANQTAATATGLINGNYVVTVTDANNCTLSASVAVAVSSTIDLENNIQLSVYPNPAQEVLFVKYESKAAGNVDVMMYDLSGRIVKEIANNQTNNFTQTIAIDNLQSGVYFLRVQSGTQVLNQRIVVE